MSDKYHIRRVQKTGVNSILLILPREWAKAKRLSQGSLVTIEEHKEYLIVRKLRKGAL